MDHPFRTSAIGGFQRQDVLDYLEKTAKQAAEAQQELKSRLTELEEIKERQDTELEELRRRVQLLEQESTKLRAQAAKTESELLDSRKTGERRAAELAAAEKELEGLREKVARLRPDAEAYLQLKDRTADVELDARRRAQIIVSEAEEKSDSMQRQMRQWYQRVEKEFGTVRTQVESIVAFTADQLDQASSSLEQVCDLMNGQRTELVSLSRICEAPDPADRIQAPMPIAEDGA